MEISDDFEVEDTKIVVIMEPSAHSNSSRKEALWVEHIPCQKKRKGIGMLCHYESGMVGHNYDGLS